MRGSTTVDRSLFEFRWSWHVRYSRYSAERIDFHRCTYGDRAKVRGQTFANVRVLLQERVPFISMRSGLRFAGMLVAMRKFTETCELRMRVFEVIGTDLWHRLVLEFVTGIDSDSRFIHDGTAA